MKTKYVVDDGSKTPYVSDVAVPYLTSSTYQLKSILGGKANDALLSDGDSDIHLIHIARTGLPKDAMISLAKYLGITLDQIALLLHTSYRNLARKEGQDMMDPHKSEMILELATFAQRGVEVLGSHQSFKDWLQSPIRSLDFKTPLDYLDTTFGIKMLLKILGRLEHGVFS